MNAKCIARRMKSIRFQHQMIHDVALKGFSGGSIEAYLSGRYYRNL